MDLCQILLLKPVHQKDKQMANWNLSHNLVFKAHFTVYFHALCKDPQTVAE